MFVLLSLLKNTKLVVACLICSVVVGGLLSWAAEVRINRIKDKQELAIKTLTATKDQEILAVRKEESDQREVILGTLNEERAKAQKIESNYDTAVAASSKLRLALANAKLKADTIDPVTGCRKGEQGRSTSDMLAGMLEGMDGHGREISRFNERLQLAGSTCEKWNISNTKKD